MFHCAEVAEKDRTVTHKHAKEMFSLVFAFSVYLGWRVFITLKWVQGCIMSSMFEKKRGNGCR